VYGFTKQAQEELSLIAGRSLKIPVVAFRYQNVYGPGQSLNNPYTGILSIFSKQIRGGSAIQIFEDGQESRDFVYVSDVVDATVLGIENEKADFEVFNVGSGVCTDVLTVAKTLVRNFGADVAVNVTGQYRIGDIRHNFADLSKVKAKLGFTPKVEFEKGIARFVEWVKTQTLTRDNYQDAMNEMKERNLFK
jgi:dTDP-L-rhamnose 4-epimerase